jgi:hypothetical protein
MVSDITGRVAGFGADASAPAGQVSDPMARAWVRYVVPAGVVFIGSLALYVATLMPGLGVWDTAEFQALGPVLGIAHPTGYPSYTLLLWLASVVLQPFGEPALRANLLSALLTSGAAALAATAIVQLTRRPVLALAGATLLAVSPIAWQNAVRAGPNALHLFLVALLLVLLLGWAQRQAQSASHAGRWLVAAAVVFGLSLGNHGLTLLLAPGVAAFVLLVAPRILWQQWRLVLACVAAVIATTVLVYAYIPLRASMNPPMNYAVPTTWEGFRYLVFAEQFRTTFHSLPPLGEAASTIWRLLADNLGLAAGVALAGFVVGLFRRPKVMALTGLWFVLTWIFALVYETADIQRYYLVPLLVACIWVAVALDAAWDLLVAAWIRAGGQQLGNLARTGVALGVIVVLLIPIVARVPAWVVNREQERSGRAWLDATLSVLPQDAVVVSHWTWSTPLWYGRWVEGRRPDVTIIDDRTVLDQGYGTAEVAVDRFLGNRPVYVIRYEPDLPAWKRRYVLEEVPGIPGGGQVWRVVGPVTT